MSVIVITHKRGGGAGGFGKSPWSPWEPDPDRRRPDGSLPRALRASTGQVLLGSVFQGDTVPSCDLLSDHHSPVLYRVRNQW